MPITESGEEYTVTGPRASLNPGNEGAFNATNQGLNIFSQLTQDILLESLTAQFNWGATSSPAAANFAQCLAVIGYFGGQVALGAALDKGATQFYPKALFNSTPILQDANNPPFIDGNGSGQFFGISNGYGYGKVLYACNLKANVKTTGEWFGATTDHVYTSFMPGIILPRGSVLYVHMDETMGSAFNMDAELQAVMVYLPIRLATPRAVAGT